MSEWWDAKNAEWDAEFEKVVGHVAARRLGDALNRIRRMRDWQRRQTRNSAQNHSWHDAELLWLEGVALERARRRVQATAVWTHLANLFRHEGWRESWYLPPCPTCALRELGFAPSWLEAARTLRPYVDSDSLPDAFARLVTGGTPSGPRARAARRRTSG